MQGSAGYVLCRVVQFYAVIQDLTGLYGFFMVLLGSKGFCRGFYRGFAVVLLSFYMFLMDSMGFYRGLKGIDKVLHGFYRVMLRFYRVLLGMSVLFWVLLRFYRVVQGCAVLQGSAGLYRGSAVGFVMVLLGFYRVRQNYAGYVRVLQGSTGFSKAEEGSKVADCAVAVLVSCCFHTDQEPSLAGSCGEA